MPQPDTTRLRIDRPERADSPFDPQFSQSLLLRLLALSPFRDMNPDNFPKRQPLPALLCNDTRLRVFRRGEIIMRAGDYGSSAFMVVSGRARVVLKPALPSKQLGRLERTERSLWRVIAQLWRNPRHPEVRTPRELGLSSSKADQTDASAILLQDVPRVLDRHQTAVIGPGEFFGEIAALSRMPRTATVFADTDGCELLEIRWQGMRDLLKCDLALQKHIDQLYRAHALEEALRALPLFRHLTPAQIEQVKAGARFATHGEYEWSGEYKRLAEAGQVATDRETAVATEGDYPDGVFIIRSGFARLTNRCANGQRTLDYLGAGRIFGLREIVHNWRNPTTPVAFSGSLRVIGYTHTLFLPTRIMEEVVLPGAATDLLPPPLDEGQLAVAVEDPLPEPEGVGRRIGPVLMEFMAEHRYFNGTATMAIDLERCTRCDDCVRACAATHGNNPRFLRRGPISGGLMIAQACMHCADPVCMIGCPTGAIHRDETSGTVVINQSTCIGCTSCANNCPYEAIRMVEARDENGHWVVDRDLTPILKATKCDLCIDQYGGPACERACPHDALKRINLTRLQEFADWLQ
jgi:Fe-S-cluster-containing dehydrogenase component/CRP-like cAMP-binding protein